MSVTIRQAGPEDALQWLELVLATLGENHPSAQVYDLAWIQAELDAAAGQETWIAVDEGRIFASISILGPQPSSDNPVANLGRNLFHPDSYANGAGGALLRKIATVTSQGRMAVARLLAADNAQQVLFEKHGFVCVGFQPLKHLHQAREEVLFYVKPVRARLKEHHAFSESLPQICELAAAALANLQIPVALAVRDGVTGYPLTAELEFQEATLDDFEAGRSRAQSANPPREISGSFNWGFGFMRVTQTFLPLRALLAVRQGVVVAGLRHYFDEQDRCVRIVDAFSADDLSMGALLNHVTRLAQAQLSAAYVEVDILVSAPRLLKSAELLGYIPVAYLPTFYSREGELVDVVKMVKLNLPTGAENTNLTAHARTIVDIVHRTLEDLKVGVAIINLLRPLKMFEGLGDGELRKIARLFTQTLYRPGETIFERNASSNEAFVVLRGKVGIHLAPGEPPIGIVEQGQIFGELAFLEGTPRGAMAIAQQACILLVMQRAGFNDLSQREPHLGMAVMRNIAQELSHKLRSANATIAGLRK